MKGRNGRMGGWKERKGWKGRNVRSKKRRKGERKE